MLKNLLLQESNRKRRKIMSAASYDELLKQVECLRSENGLLRRELQDNSVHLTKLESEACNMKDVLTGIQTSMADEVEGNYALNLSFEQQQQLKLDLEQEQRELQEQQRKQDEEATTASSNSLLKINTTGLLELDQNSNASFTGSNGSFDGDETTTDQNWMSISRNNLYSANTSASEIGGGEDPIPVISTGQDDGGGSGGGGGGGGDEHGSRHSRSSSCSSTSGGAPDGQHSHKCASTSPTEGSPSKRRSSSSEREIYTYIQELDQERTSILREIETEDKHRKWYYEQLEGLTKKIETLPLTDTYNLQADMTRRQLEYEVSRLSDLMADNLGTSEQIAQRHEARLARIRVIESEMLRMQQRHHDQFPNEPGGNRDSGTCDHQESVGDRGVVVIDAATNTLVTGDAFLNKTGNGFDQGNYDGRLGLVDNGSKVVTIGTQTLGDYSNDPQAHNDQDACNLSNQNLASLYHGSWPIERQGSRSEGSLTTLVNQQETASVMSFNSSNASSGSHRVSNKQLGTKVEMVYSLLSMLGTHDKDDMSRTLFAMSSSQDSCIAMRQSGCLPLLVQLLHGSDKDSGLLGNTRGSKAARARAAAALHNIVHSHPDDKRGRREARVLRLLEQIRAHCDQLREMTEDMEEDDDGRSRNDRAADIDHHPGPAIAALMKLSFDEEHRHAICTLGGLQAIAELLQVDHDVNGNTAEQYNITMRRYACMALTNLTFGDGTNKALLCSMKSCMRALVAQLHSPNEDLRQVAASVLRNLSWRADLASKKTLREVGAVTALMCASMEVKKESTLKSILSALWNLSAHCSENKADICAVDGSLAFLVSTLTYKSPSKTLAIIENGGGILRNISSHIAVREDYRKILRQHGCLQILLKHLRSPSLTIVSNACGTLWNLSARCPEDQKALWEMGAVSMLRNLVHSKHKMISMGSAAALKNLLAAKPAMVNLDLDRHTKSNMPSLHVRKQRALEAELDQNLAETCDNVESPQGSPTEIRKHIPAHDANKYMYTSENCGIYQVAENDQHRRSMIRGHHLGRNLSGENSPRSPQRSVSRSASQDSVGSTHSDISHDRNRVQDVLRKSSKLLQERQNMNLDRRRDHPLQRSFTEGMKTSGSDSSITRNAPNSRIMQVMHEVAVHAGIDPGPFKKEQYGPHLPDSQSVVDVPPQNGPRTASGDQSCRSMPVFNHSQAHMSSYNQGGQSDDNHSDDVGGSASVVSGGSMASDKLNNSQPGGGRAMPFANLSHCMDNLHLSDDQDEHMNDAPINYSMKYSESPQSESGDQSSTSAFVKPVPKVGNFVAGLSQSSTGNSKPQQRKQMESGRDEGSDESQLSSSKTAQSNENNSRNIPQYSGYAETDLDTDEMDQPTNYSIRFAEHNDDGHFTDQPINYSTRFKEPEGSCVECKMEAQRCNEYVEHLEPHINDDAVLTFCTEGTPLNYLSNATSMNDLSGKGNGSGAHKHTSNDHKSKHDHLNSGSGKIVKPTPIKSYSDANASENQSRPAVKQVEAANIQNNNVSVGKSVPNADELNLYAYDDTSTSASPSEKPTKYCTEGTPMSFSRVSSLSSLHSGDQESAHQSPPSEPRSRDEMTLQSIDENTSLEMSASADVTIRPADDIDDSIQSTNNTTLGSQGNDSTASTTHKSVTFDDNNQVQETPLMFSRCSSLGSLSSFDAHSVHSSVVSEYSRRASEVVSPSDLPDSPSDTMPPSPTHRKSPVKFIGASAGHEESNDDIDANVTQVEQLDKTGASGGKSVSGSTSTDQCSPKATIDQVAEEMFADMTMRYGDEKSPQGFSCGSSLSRLTFDDEPVIHKDFNLRRVPLGQEDKENDGISNTTGNDSKSVNSDGSEDKDKSGSASPIPKVDLDDLDDLSVSGEEDMLAACINMAMPNNSRKKMRRSTSDSHLKKAVLGKVNHFGASRVGGLGHTPITSTPAGKSKLPTKIPNVAMVAPMSSYRSGAGAGANIYSSPRMNSSYHGSLSHHHDIFDDPSDTPKNFATEGTPLNFSNTGSLGGSLSDLSVGDLDDTQGHQQGDGDSSGFKKTHRPAHITTHEIDNLDADDAKSDMSSLSEDNEDLLSEAIEAAMPKNKPKAKKMDRVAEGSDTKIKTLYHIPSFKPKKSNVDSQPAAPNHRTVSMPLDTMMSYATEGTPLNFSTANSLSDLSCDDEPDDRSRDMIKGKVLDEEDEDGVLPPPPAYQDTSGRYGHPHVLDSPRVFDIEGTPVSFSRNDSLSSLSCDEDAEIDKEHMKRVQGPRGHVSPGGSITPPSSKGLLTPKNKRISQLSGAVSPSTAPAARASKAHRSLQYNQEIPPPEIPHLEVPDQPQMYAVEGTPNHFSRNSSLSSLNSDDHEGLAQRHSGSCSNEHSPEPSHDQCASLQVEDTPRVFSRNSSLSSLSVESLSSEPTASEKALLEECINAAMPKSKGNKKKKSPTSGAAPKLPKMKTSQSDESNLSAHVGVESPKNAMASQSKNEFTTEESRGPNDDASGVVFRRSASEGSKTRFGWRRPSTCDTNETKQSKEVYNHEQVLGNSGQGGESSANEINTESGNRFLIKNKDKTRSSSNAESNDAEESISSDALLLQLGKHNDHLQNVFMEMPTAANEACDDSDPEKQLIREEDDLPTVKEQQAIGINEKDHCSEPSETEEIDSASISSSHSVNDSDADRDNLQPPTKERASFYLEGNLDDCHLTCNPLEDSGEVPDFMDITNETFPDSMGVSLISDISTPGEDIPPPLVNELTQLKDVANIEECEEIWEPPEGFNDYCHELDSTNTDTPVISSEDTTVIENQDLEIMLEMSPEQERALEENASLIVSELSLTRHLSSSTLDDEAFIENETISLVSNDCMSDTASEASIALSSSSKTMSEQASESSTVSLHSSVPSPKRIGGPSIEKPKSLVKKPSAEDTAHGIRGKRRSLFSRVAPKPQKSPSPPPGKSIRGGFTPPKNKEAGTSKTKEQGKPSPAPKTTVKPPQPRLRTPPPPRNPRLSTRSSTESISKGSDISTKTSSSFLNKLSPSSGKASTSSPKTARNAKPITPKGGLNKIASKINTGLPKSSPKGKDQKGKGKQSSSSETPERPPPPVKQGTFTKDEPSVLSEAIGEESDQRASGGSQSSIRSSSESKYSNESQEKLSKANGAIPKRSSSSSLSERPGSWSRSLDSDAEIPVENGIQKGSSPAPLTAVRKSSVGSVSKSSSSGSIGIVSKSSSNSSFGKTGSNNSINKSGSNSSVNKLGFKPLTRSSSGTPGKKTTVVSPMKKTVSNTSLTKLGPISSPSSSKTTVKKSESQTSLGRKTGVNGRPSTPPTRKLSTGSSSSPTPKKTTPPASSSSTPPKKTPASGSKKPAVSKIAGLWRKDDKKSASTSSDSPKPKPEPESKPKVGSKSPKTGRRSLLSVVKPDKAKKEEAEKQKKELTRSSTYDKLPLPDDAESTSEVQAEEPQEPTPGVKRQWRRTYTIDSDDTVFCVEGDAPAGPSKSLLTDPQSHKKSNALWRRNATDSNSTEVKKSGTWKKSNLENGTMDSGSGSPSKLPRPGNSSVGAKKTGSLIPSPSKSSSEKVANGHVTNGLGISSDGSKPMKPTQLLGKIPKKDDKTITVSSPKGELNAAIVAPYNYTPTQKTTTGISSTVNTTAGTSVSPIKIGKLPKQQFTEITYQCNDSMVTVQGLAPSKPKATTQASATRPLTKTEMLIARRRQSYLNSRNREDQKSSEEQGQQSTCLVTTV